MSYHYIAEMSLNVTLLFPDYYPVSREMADSLRSSQGVTKNNVGCYIGIRVLLGLNDEAKPASSPEYMAWITHDGSMRNRLMIKQYTCEERWALVMGDGLNFIIGHRLE